MKVLESPKRKQQKEAEYLRNKRIRKIRRRRKLRAEQLAKGKIPSYADGKDDDDDDQNSFLLQNPTEFILSFLKAPAITDPTSVVSNTPLISMYSLNLDEFKHGKDSGIHIKKSKRGTFTRAAKQHGMGVQEFARKVLNAPKGKYSSAMRKKANFARNASKFKH